MVIAWQSVLIGFTSKLVGCFIQFAEANVRKISFLVGVTFQFLGFCGLLSAQETYSRRMDDLNWMEFREIVPAKVKTVLLTTGTLEPHGVVNNGADNLAPVRIAEAVAPEVNALLAPHIPYGVTGSMAR